MAKQVDLAGLEADFEVMKTDGTNLQQTLATATAEYGKFLQKYNEMNERILATAAEAKEAKDAINSEAAGKSSVVLVLIDASSHTFCDELIKKRGPGGAEAAKLLREAVNEKIAARFSKVAPNSYSLVVKIFACLKTLGLDSASTGKTLLLPFLTEFGKAGAFFDLVVTADDLGVKSKVCENLKLYMANEQCKQVFLAAAESPRYHQVLKPIRGRTKNVMLIFGSGFDEELRKLGMSLVTFPKIFSAPLGVKIQTGQSGAIAKGLPKVDPTSTASLIDTEADHNAAGFTPYSTQLPTSYIGGRIPVNSEQQRIDLYVRAPTTTELEIYNEQYRRGHLCNYHYLGNRCTFNNCKYYHGDLAPEAYHVLQYQVRRTRCVKGSRCRALDCFRGHVCQRKECACAEKRVKSCVFPEFMHRIDLKIADWVKPCGGPAAHSTARSAPLSVTDAASQLTTLSVKNESPPPEQEDLMM